MTEVRKALGTDRFDEAFATGARLNQREAVAAAQGRRGETGSLESGSPFAFSIVA